MNLNSIRKVPGLAKCQRHSHIVSNNLSDVFLAKSKDCIEDVYNRKSLAATVSNRQYQRVESDAAYALQNEIDLQCSIGSWLIHVLRFDSYLQRRAAMHFI